jgi:cytidyltransferase-like protein
VQKHEVAAGHKHNLILSSFLDVFCDKFVTVLTLFALLLLTDYHSMSGWMETIYVGVCSALLIYEFALGSISVIDFFPSFPNSSQGFARIGAMGPCLAFSMWAKIKEKLDMVGIGLLCLTQPTPTSSPLGILALAMLIWSLFLSHRSLAHKLGIKLRHLFSRKRREASDYRVVRQKVIHSGLLRCDSLLGSRSSDLEEDDDGAESEEESVPESPMPMGNQPFTTAYTVGCFDLFHRGHVALLRNMRREAKRIVIGVHDDESIFLLKNRYPIDNTVKRIRNVKRYADVVFVIPAPDPSPFLDCVIDRSDASTSVYIRGDDMPDFPGKSVAEQLMAIELLPYTQGISSTMLRKKLVDETRKADTTRGGELIRYGHEWIPANHEWIKYGDNFVQYRV